MNATDRVRLTINLEQVAKNLRTPDGNSVGEGTAKSYLKHVGVVPDDAGAWVGPRSGLGRLNDSDCVSAPWTRKLHQSFLPGRQFWLLETPQIFARLRG